MRRKIRNKKNYKIMYFIIGISFIFLLFIGIAYAKTSSKIFVEGTARVKNNNIQVNIKQESYIDEYQVIRYSYSYTIQNNTQNSFNNWRVLISNLPLDITEITQWNHDVVSQDVEKGHLVLKGKTWNENIAPNGSITINFTFLSKEKIDKDYIKIAIHHETTEGITGIKLNVTSSIIKVKNKLTLVATKIPENSTQTVIWSSSNHNVATVSNKGIVTGISQGETIITATAGNYSASCKVRVIDDATQNKKVSVTFVKTNYWTGNIQFKITVTNSNNSPINNWQFEIGMPQNSMYSIWSANCYNNGNIMYGNEQISARGTFDIYGQITLPEDEDVNNYLNPLIFNINGS